MMILAVWLAGVGVVLAIHQVITAFSVLRYVKYKYPKDDTRRKMAQLRIFTMWMVLARSAAQVALIALLDTLGLSLIYGLLAVAIMGVQIATQITSTVWFQHYE